MPGPEGSVLKLLQGRLSQDISEFVVDMQGAGGMLCTKYTEARGEPPSQPDPVIAFVSSPASTIAGGSNDIQRNIIGDRVLRPAARARLRPEHAVEPDPPQLTDESAAPAASPLA